jgi:hypothetical protein
MRQGDFHWTEIELLKKEKERKTGKKKKIAQIKTNIFFSFHLPTFFRLSAILQTHLKPHTLTHKFINSQTHTKLT